MCFDAETHYFATTTNKVFQRYGDLCEKLLSGSVREIRKLIRKKRRELRQLAIETKKRDAEIKARITDPAIRRISERFNLGLLERLLELIGWKDMDIIDAFCEGFDILGEIGPFGMYGFDAKKLRGKPQDIPEPGEIVRRNLALFGSLKVDEHHRVVVEKMEKDFKLGRATEVLTDQEEIMALARGGDAVFSPCFGLDQGNKVRPVHDLKKSKVNDLTRLWEFVRMENCDTLGEFARSFHNGRDEVTKEAFVDAEEHPEDSASDSESCAGATPGPPAKRRRKARGAHKKDGFLVFKADHEGAFRWIPIRPEHRRFMWTVIRTPDGLRAQRHNVMSFGGRAAPCQYYRLADAVTAIEREFMLCPVGHYMDDWFGIVPRALAKEAFRSFITCHELIGVQLASDKTQKPEETMEVLGLVINCEDFDRVTASAKPSRCENLEREFRGFVLEGKIDHSKCDRIAGKLNFLLTGVFGKFGKPYARVFYRLAGQTGNKSTSLKKDPQLRNSLAWWLRWLPKLPNIKRSLLEPAREQVVLSTDAQSAKKERGRYGIGCHLQGGDSSIPSWTCGREVSRRSIGLPEGARIPIAKAETAAAVGFVYTLRKQLAGTQLTLQVDNCTAAACLREGGSPDETLNRAAALFWDICSEFNILCDVSLVRGSEIPIADKASRGQGVNVRAFEEREEELVDVIRKILVPVIA